jgi:hypothetical protein
VTRRHHRARVAGLVPAVICTLAVAAAATACSPSTSGAGSASAAAATTAAASPSTSPADTGTPSPSSSPPATTPQPQATPRSATLAVVPRSGSEPKVRFPTAPAAQGKGAHPVITAVPGSEWTRMVGFSWTKGCPVGRASLRLVQVNYWGFDGVRHRGRLVVRSSIAARAAQAFGGLYAMKFRIRQMVPMDSTWGHNPKGLGANDYAAMRADNTSGFNCRYVGGEESRKVWSHHAYGLAIDVNDLENPYVADNGTVYPNAYFLHRRTGAGIFRSSSSPAVRAFTRLGFHWGGRWSEPDLQHMELS